MSSKAALSLSGNGGIPFVWCSNLLVKNREVLDMNGLLAVLFRA